MSANWQGAAAPGGTVGTLTFPEISAPFVEECTKLAATCYQSKNDVSGLDVNAISFGPFGLAPLYNFTGTGLTLGSGGLSTSGSGDGRGTVSWGIPLTLGASQTWKLAQALLELEAEVTGSTAALSVQFGFASELTVEHRVDTGPITLDGTTYGGFTELYNGSLNATDKQPVNLTNTALIVPALFKRRTTTAATGPLTLTGESTIVLGEPLTVSGTAKFVEDGGISLDVSAPPNPSGKLSATGNVSLSSAELSLHDYSCGAPLAPGEVHTLITTTGTLSGTFRGVPNGSLLEVTSGGDSCEIDPPVRINYTSHSVTATVIQVEPIGGALGYGELAAGGHNPSEFCLFCFMGKLISFIWPVDAPTGNFWHTFDDLKASGRGIALDLERTYNSMSAGTDSPFGFGWSFPYDMSLNFTDATHVLVNQEGGSQVTFTEGTGGTYTAPPRVTATLTHNGDGTWTFLRRHRDAFTFEASGKLTQEKDLNGYVTALAYNGSGQLSTVTDPAGRKLTFTYAGNHISSVTDPLGRVVSYSYDGEGNLIDVTDVNGGNTHFAYDSAHRMLTMRLPNQAPGVTGSTGALISNKYDGQGRVVEQTDQLGRTTQFSYAGEPFGKAGGSTTITDPKGNVTVQDYQFGELVSETKGFGTPQATTWTFGYDPATLGMTSVTDPNGHTTTSTFDSEGNTLTTTDPLGRITTNTYDSLNDLLTTTDPLDMTTTKSYDAHGNLLSISRPTGKTSETQTTTYAYGDVSHPGDVTAITDPEGKIWTYAYDVYGDRTSSTDPLGNRATSTYNIDGWLLSTTSPRGNTAEANPVNYTTTYAHNNFGQTTETVDPLGHKTVNLYDADQNLIASTDADGNTTTYTHDAADEQTAAHRADGTTLRTTYWPDGTTKEQIDGASHATSYEYDPLGRVSAVTDPLGHSTRYGYDPAGNRTTSTDPEERVTTTTYDAANEPTSIAYSDGKTPNVTGIAYDADGERIGETDGSGTWSWTWDSLHRLTSVAEGNNGTVNYQYDLRNNLISITYPNGKTVTRGYDGADRWTQVTDWLGNMTKFDYDAEGNLIAETLPAESGITDSYTYASDGSLSAVSDMRGASSIFQSNYARDANQQLTSDTSQTAGEGSYGYDALNRLCYSGSSAVSCTSPPSGAAQYQYDSADNPVRMGQATQTFNAGDELTSVSTPMPGKESPEGGVSQQGTPQPGGGIAPGVVKVQSVIEGRLTPSVTSGKVRFTSTGNHSAKTLSQSVSTKTAGDLVLAFLSEKGAPAQHTSVKGAGLKWTLVTTESGSGGSLGVWQARAPKSLKHARIAATPGRGARAALATVAFDAGAAVTDTAKAARSTRTPSVAVVVPSNTVVWAVGQQTGHRGRPNPSKGQALLTSIAAPSGDTSWLQSDTPGAAGRVTVADSTAKRAAWMLAAVTIQERAGSAKAARAASFSYGPLASASLATGASVPSSPTGRAATTPPADPGATETSTFSYDSEGDRTGVSSSSGSHQTYSYNQALELTDVGSEISYAYNGDGLRTAKTVGARTTPFTWDVSGGLSSLLEDSADAYVYGPGGLAVEQISGNTALWFHHDQLGSTRALTNAAGQAVATYAYTPYGSLSSSSGTASTPLLYTGQYRDSESGLYYLRARYYDPATGQFLTIDPAVATTKAPYGYAGENPLNWTDPSGLEVPKWKEIIIGVIGIIEILFPVPGPPAGLGGSAPTQPPIIVVAPPPGSGKKPPPTPAPTLGAGNGSVTNAFGNVNPPFKGTTNPGAGTVTNPFGNLNLVSGGSAYNGSNTNTGGSWVLNLMSYGTSNLCATNTVL